MKCKVCGYTMADDAAFCEYCGAKAEIEQQTVQNFKYCGSCGSKMGINDAFCGSCGAGKEQTHFDNGKQIRGNNTSKGSVNITLIVLLTAMIVLLSVILGFVIYGGGSDKEEPSPSPQTTQTAEPTETPTPTIPVITTVPQQPVQPQPYGNSNPSQQYYGRVDLYNPGLYYKRMSGIHNTSITDDYTYYEISGVIYQFDSDCEGYMNGLTNVVPMTLRRGSTAYNQQVDYKKNHPTLTQYYENINVINTRYGGGYYYAWVEETLRVTEKGATKVVTDRWVYKLSKSGGVWYIDDYTRDPAF